jgi:uncharacterized membrane protein YjdF
VSWSGVGILAAGLVVGIARHDPRAVIALFLHLAAALAVVLRFRRSAPLTGLFVLAMGFNAFGWAWRWLDTVWRYDDVSHGFVTLTMTALVGSGLLRPLRAELLARRWLLALLLVCVGLTGSVLWELFEWLCDHFVTPPGQMRIADTMSDLLFDLFGALLSVPLGIQALKQPASEQPSRVSPGAPKKHGVPGGTADAVP